MTETRISFVVASYNGAAYIEEQLTSILDGLAATDEVVVADDGSSDATVERVRALCDPRVRLVVGGTRLGYQGNFARAIDASKGQYVFFSDQDDICLPARIPLSMKALQERSCVCGDAVVVDDALKPIHASYFSQRRARFGAVSLLLRPAVIGATLACRREFLLGHMPFPDGVPHDLWLSVSAARHGQLVTVREPFILYRRHGMALSATGAVSRRPIAARVKERALLISALLRTRERNA